MQTPARAWATRIEDDQDVATPRGPDGIRAVGLLAGILGVLFLIAATVGAASPTDLTSTAGTRASAAAQQDSTPMLDWYRISDSR